MTYEIAHSMEIKVMIVPEEEVKEEKTLTFPNRTMHEKQLFGNVAHSVAFECRRLPYFPFDFSKNFNLEDAIGGFDYIMEMKLLENNNLGG